MDVKGVLSSAGLAKATSERWQRATQRYNRLHFPICGNAIYHDINGDTLLSVGSVYLFVNSSTMNFELLENEQYYHMYVDFKTVPPLLNRSALEVELKDDYYLTNLIKSVQCLVEEHIRLYGINSIKKDHDSDIFKQAQGLLRVIIMHLGHKYGLQVMENPKIEKAIQYIEEHCTEHITNDDVSSILHVDTRYLIRLFNKYVGMPPYQYLTQCRIEHAIEELRQNKTVTEVALQCGYQNETAFRIAFKKVMGCSPTAYLNKYREGRAR